MNFRNGGKKVIKSCGKLFIRKFVHKLTNKKLPATFNHFFTAVSKIHSRYTRNSTKPNQYFIPFFHTSRSQRTIKFRGVLDSFGQPLQGIVLRAICSKLKTRVLPSFLGQNCVFS